MPPAPPPPVAAYLSLSQTERASQAGLPALVGLLQQLATGYDPSYNDRRSLLSALLASASAGLDDPAPSPLLVPLCTTLKLLGRNPAGSEELARQNGIRVLLRLGGLERVADLPRPGGFSPTATDEEDDDEAALAEKALSCAEKDPLAPAEAEALRCLCNVLMLHPSARDVFPEVLIADEKRAALRGMVRVLGCSGAGFLAGRLLFLLTSKASDLIAEIATGGECVEALEELARRYLAIYNSPSHRASLSSGPPTTTMDDILREHLKLAYNLMLQHSRQSANISEGLAKTTSADENGGKKKRFWRSREKNGEKSGSSTASNSPDLPQEEASETALSSSPPTSTSDAPRSKSPLSFARRAVDAVKHRGGSTPTSPDPSHRSSPKLGEASTAPAASSAQSSSVTAAPQEGNSPDALSLDAAHLFLPLFQPYLSIAVLLPLLPPSPTPAQPPSTLKDPSPLVRAALAALLNFPLELEELSGWSTSWLQYVPTRLAPDGSVLRGGGIGSLGERLLELLRGVCDAYFPPDRVPENAKLLTKKDREEGRKLEAPCSPDEWIPTGEGEATKIEEILGPVMLLLRKMSMLGEAQYVFRELLMPANLDRSKPLDRHPTLSGHLVRLLSSVLLPNTSFGVGEFIYNLCDRDPLTLVRAIGYGNASGFLQNRGELIPPPPGDEPAAGSKQRAVNPITGAYEEDADPDYVPMSEEEKEREAERLYTLFDRMSRNGVISAENPVDKARAEGRFEETSEQREAELERLRKEDEDLEKEVERDMAAWKERRKKAAEAGIDPAQVPE
ncbi:hypothetical protein JCM10213_007312 [Rhodosporidiobolus nylandii]